MLSAGVTFVVNQFTKRLDNHEKEDKETFVKLFEGQAKVLEAVNAGFRNTDKTLNESVNEISHNVNEIHIKLLERISDIQQGKNDT